MDGMNPEPPSPQNRLLGGLYGSLLGDALGVPVEFAGRETRRRDPVTGMRGYGTHGQPAGTWSDDGALLLCSVESLATAGFDTRDMASRFVRWHREGHWSAHGCVFDIGIATASALRRVHDGVPAEEAGGRGEHSNGNGSLMRILPLALAFPDLDAEVLAGRVSRASAITHGHPRSQMACVFYCLLARELAKGQNASDALATARDRFSGLYNGKAEWAAFSGVIDPDLSSWQESRISGSGYVMDTLTASIWCLLTTATFRDCVLKAVNLGEDTDTTGCVAGGLAGLLYGFENLPGEWLALLPRREELEGLFCGFAKTLVI